MLLAATCNTANPPALLASAQKNSELPSGTEFLWCVLVSILPLAPITKYSTEEFFSFKCYRWSAIQEFNVKRVKKTQTQSCQNSWQEISMTVRRRRGYGDRDDGSGKSGIVIMM